jgi:hypothetical protein
MSGIIPTYCTWLVLTLAKLVYDGKLMFAKARGKKKPRK